MPQHWWVPGHVTGSRMSPAKGSHPGLAMLPVMFVRFLQGVCCMPTCVSAVTHIPTGEEVSLPRVPHSTCVVLSSHRRSWHTVFLPRHRFIATSQSTGEPSPGAVAWHFSCLVFKSLLMGSKTCLVGLCMTGRAWNWPSTCCRLSLHQPAVTFMKITAIPDRV